MVEVCNDFWIEFLLWNYCICIYLEWINDLSERIYVYNKEILAWNWSYRVEFVYFYRLIKVYFYCWWFDISY
jgi:hypothetical protein